jgi:YidC/Oxa1 family membrane protein insertase
VDFLNNALLYVLNAFHSVIGSYALSIIAVTALIRLVLWPLNASQTKSMKAMQVIQPKLKALQEQYKGDPQRMQAEMMKLYSENKFNPLGGCLPMLVQLPIFIGLYGALMSPQFQAAAGNESFLFINKLSHTLYTQGGDALDKTFGVKTNDTFTVGPTWQAYFKGHAEPQAVKLQELRINDAEKILSSEPKPLIPGDPVQFSIIGSDVSTSKKYLDSLDKLIVPITVKATHELEQVTLTPKVDEPGVFTSSLPTKAAKGTLHWDVLVLIALYGLLSWAFQWSNQRMMGASAATGQQAMMMKWMPLMFLLFMVIIPIPAGVMLYLLVTMVMMVLQNIIPFNKDKKTDGTPVVSSTSGNSKTISVTAE